MLAIHSCTEMSPCHFHANYALWETNEDFSVDSVAEWSGTNSIKKLLLGNDDPYAQDFLPVVFFLLFSLNGFGEGKDEWRKKIEEVFT